MYKRQVVIRTGTSGNWTQISLNNGSYGYVSTAYLRSISRADGFVIGKGMHLEGSGITSGGTTSTGNQYYATTSLNLRKGDVYKRQLLSAQYSE